MPAPADLRYNWVVVRLAEIERAELAELLLDAWCIVVSAKRSAAFLATLPADWPHSLFGRDGEDSPPLTAGGSDSSQAAVQKRGKGIDID